MATCPSCKAESPAGLRWCSLCHANLLDATVGRLASPFKRLAALVLDIAIPFITLGVLSGVAATSAPQSGEAGGSAGAVISTLLLVGYVVWALMLFSRGTTPGKLVLRMRVVKEAGQRAGFGTMLVREWIGKWISGIILGLGFLWILFDRDRQGWHDKLMTTYVVEKAPADA